MRMWPSAQRSSAGARSGSSSSSSARYGVEQPPSSIQQRQAADMEEISEANSVSFHDFSRRRGSGSSKGSEGSLNILAPLPNMNSRPGRPERTSTAKASNTSANRRSTVTTSNSASRTNNPQQQQQQHQKVHRTTSAPTRSRKHHKTSSTNPQVQEAQQIARFLFQRLEEAHDLLLEQERVLENRMDTIRILTYHCVRLERHILQQEHPDAELPELPPLEKVAVVPTTTSSAHDDSAPSLDRIAQESQSPYDQDPSERAQERMLLLRQQQRHSARVEALYGKETSERLLESSSRNHHPMPAPSSASPDEEESTERSKDAQQEYFLGLGSSGRFATEKDKSEVHDLSSVEDFLTDEDPNQSDQKQHLLQDMLLTGDHEDDLLVDVGELQERLQQESSSEDDEDRLSNLQGHLQGHLQQLRDLTTELSTSQSLLPTDGPQPRRQPRQSLPQGESLVHLHLHCADLEKRVKQLEAIVLQQQQLRPGGVPPTQQQQQQTMQDVSQSSHNDNDDALMEQVKRHNDEFAQSIHEASSKGVSLEDLATSWSRLSSKERPPTEYITFEKPQPQPPPPAETKPPAKQQPPATNSQSAVTRKPPPPQPPSSKKTATVTKQQPPVQATARSPKPPPATPPSPPSSLPPPETMPNQSNDDLAELLAASYRTMDFPEQTNQEQDVAASSSPAPQQPASDDKKLTDELAGLLAASYSTMDQDTAAAVLATAYRTMEFPEPSDRDPDVNSLDVAQIEERDESPQPKSLPSSADTPDPNAQPLEEVPPIPTLQEARASFVQQQQQQGIFTPPLSRTSSKSSLFKPATTAALAAASRDWWQRGTYEHTAESPNALSDVVHLVEYMDDSDCSNSDGETVEETMEEYVVPRPSFNRVSAYEAGIGAPPSPLGVEFD